MSESSNGSSNESRPVRSRVVLRNISSRAWEHPADRGALVALRKLRGFDTVVKLVSGLFRERKWRLLFLGAAVRVDDRQFPVLHRALNDAAGILDAETVPELYVLGNPNFNAWCMGMDKPFILVNSGLVDLMDEDELRWVLAHELGHAMSGHALYRTILERLMRLTGVFGAIPLGGLGARVILAGLMEWYRKSELSADRAGLLATQDPAAAYRALMKLASGGHLEDLDQTSFFAQGAEYDDTDLRDSVLKIQLVEGRTHPMPVSRASELRNWVDSGAYTAILAGEYPTRDTDADAKLSEAAQEAANSYSETFRETQDSLGRLVHDAAGWMGSAKLWWDEQWRRRDDDEEAS
jgi:Zn-dependent protease with chaperone function